MTATDSFILLNMHKTINKEIPPMVHNAIADVKSTSFLLTEFNDFISRVSLFPVTINIYNYK
jgi:hypothetical protein